MNTYKFSKMTICFVYSRTAFFLHAISKKNSLCIFIEWLQDKDFSTTKNLCIFIEWLQDKDFVCHIYKIIGNITKIFEKNMHLKDKDLFFK